MAVAEELNFRRAATRLRLAQPALSAQIKALESELGQQLFERTTRTVSLTPTGQVLLVEARTVLAAAAKAEHHTRQAGQGLAGTLRVGVIAPAANARLAAILRRFRQEYPGVQLSLHDLTSTEQLQQLREDQLDLGLLRPPVGFPDLEYRFLEESPMVLAVPSGHRLAKAKRIDWKDFHGEPMVMIHPSMQHGYYDPFLARCARAGAVPGPVQHANDIQTKMWLISAGFGVAPTTGTLAEVQRPGLVFRDLPKGLPQIQTVIAWKRSNDSLLLRNFLACLELPGSATLMAPTTA